MNFANLTNSISGLAMLALAALPAAALTTAAHASPASVRVADLNLASVEGVATFQQRAEFAARKFCSPDRSLSSAASCRKGVKTELTEKMDALRASQAARTTTTFAAR